MANRHHYRHPLEERRQRFGVVCVLQPRPFQARAFCRRTGMHCCPTGAPIECPVAALQDGNDPLTALEASVLRLNRRQQLITGRPDEVVRNCRQIYDPIFLRRAPHTELEFAEFVTAFARVVYDGTNGLTSAADRGTVRPTLPSWFYRDHRSVIVHVIALRNHYLHGLSPNDTTAAEHLASAGDVFQHYAGKRVPDDQDFAAMRVRMLDAAVRLVDGLAAHVPVRDALNADAVFANRNGDGVERLLPQVNSMDLEQNDMEDRRWPTDTRAA